MQNVYNAIDDLLATCEKEPIHIPGCIQPFGVLMVIDEHTLEIQHISENCIDHWGVSASNMVGQSLKSWLHEQDVAALRQYLRHPFIEEQSPLPINLPIHAGRMRGAWELNGHKYNGRLIVELETAVRHAIAPGALPFHRKVRDAVQSLQHAETLLQLCDSAVREVKAITGFERVMIYRFDSDWHGYVISEICDPGMDSYLGHHFPASDIPAQARKIFLQNWVRMIPDVNYIPSPIYPPSLDGTETAIDLSKAALRSVSPIHLEYLRNMNVGASLTVSLIEDGELWGLIACHHSSSLFVNAEDRLGAQLIGQIVSSQLRIKESLEDLAYKEELKAIHGALLSQMESEADLVQGLVRHSPNLLDIAGANGAAAAIYFDGQWTLVGNTPTLAQIEDLVTWLADTHSNEGIFHTDSLSHLYPPADAYRQTASGIIAVLIPKTKRSYLLWFRPEVATTVTWAGNPDKAALATVDDLRVHPRKSFASWNEIVVGKARPWKKVELEAVSELRNSILALDLERQFNKELKARNLAEKLAREKEDMVMVVSHDLKAPLAVTKLSLEVLDSGISPLDAQAQELVLRGLRATHAMETLVTDILDMAKIDSDNLQLELQSERVDDLLEDIAGLFAPLAHEKHIHFEVVPPSTRCEANCERGRIHQVLSNLVGNAIKFTPEGGVVMVRVEQCTEQVTFSVSDTGRGIAAESLPRIFDRFWQAGQTRRMGTGLGLSIARGIIEKHSGKIWVESTEGVGSTFHFSIPRAIPATG